MSVTYRFIIAIFVGALLGAAPSVAALLDITFRPEDGDYIEASDFNDTWDEIEAVVNNLDAANIDDSSITSGKLASNSVTADNLAALAVKARNIDSGAIADTMFSVEAKNWLLANSVGDSAITGTDIQRNAIDYRHMNYSDTRNWDSMPVVMQTGYYVGNGGTPQFVATNIWPRTVYVYGNDPRVAAMTNAQRVDTVSYNVPFDTYTLTLEIKNPTVDNIDSAAYRGFSVYAGGSGSHDDDLQNTGSVYYYTVWGYRRQ